MGLTKDRIFQVATSTLVAALVLPVLTYLYGVPFDIPIGPFSLSHVFSYSGFFFIAFYTPAYYAAKRRYPLKVRNLVNAHMFGSLVSFLLISLHFGDEFHHILENGELALGGVLYVAS